MTLSQRNNAPGVDDLDGPVDALTAGVPQPVAQTAATLVREAAPLAQRALSLDIDLTELTDDDVIAYIKTLWDEREYIFMKLDGWVNDAKRELLQRMQVRGARAIPNADFEVALEDVHTEWLYDHEALYEAQNLLPEDEAAKLLRRVPEQVVAAHFEPGNPRSIAALQKKYGTGTPVGDLLAAGMTRTFIDHRLSFKRRKG